LLKSTNFDRWWQKKTFFEVPTSIITFTNLS
jgi:hypothetical protein